MPRKRNRAERGLLLVAVWLVFALAVIISAIPLVSFLTEDASVFMKSKEMITGGVVSDVVNSDNALSIVPETTPEIISENTSTLTSENTSSGGFETAFVGGPEGEFGILEEANSTECGYVNSDLTLTASVTNRSTCFNINASNIILDCAGFTIDYGTNSTGPSAYGINNTDGGDNVTVKNCLIQPGSTGSFGIIFSSVVNGTIQNNTV